MSKIALSSNNSGSATFTIASLGTNTNQMLTLPDASGTINVSGLANEVPAGSNTAPAIYSTGDNNTGLFFPAADTVAVTTGGIERMRIDASGNLLVGTTSSSAFPSQTTGGMGVYQMGTTFSRSPQNASGRYWFYGSEGASGASYVIYNAASTGVYIAYGGTAWSANSDERMKTTLVPFEDAVGKVCSLRAGTGRYLTDEEGVSRSFLIAQDVQAVLPEAVDIKEDEQGTLGIRYTDVVPLLVAAIKEQQALITALTARVAELEAK